MKFLHIIHWDKKFSKNIIDMINTYDKKNDHNFIIWNTKKENIDFFKEYNNVIHYENNFLNLIFILFKVNGYDKVFINGLFDIKSSIMAKLLFFKQTCGVFWGGDIYYGLKQEKTIKWKIKELIRKIGISSLNEIIAWNKGDLEILEKLYGTYGKKGTVFFPFSIPIKVVDKYLKKTNKVTLNIMVGNSADPSNNHIEVLNKLKNFKDQNINIIVPLNYGNNKEYIQNVVKVGNDIFGKKFQPLLNFLSIESYLKLLNEVDISIYNHHRQQAGQNIILLLYMGKKVFIRSDISTYDMFFNYFNCDICDTYSLDSLTFEEFKDLNNINKIKNQEITSSMIKIEDIYKTWEKTFYE